MRHARPPAHPSKVQNGATPQPKRKARVFPRQEPTSSQDVHKALPHSIEAEQGVLCSMLLSPFEIIGECIERVTEEYFYLPAHQTIYVTLVELWRARAGIDLITFTQVLRDRNLLETVGGAAFITQLYTFVPTAANVVYYLEIVRDKYILRQIIATCTENVRKAYEEQDEVNALLADVERVTLLIRPVEQHRERGIKEGVMEAIEGMERAYENKGSITGIPTGFKELDRLTSGLQPQDMVVIAGRPSMGKTALAMNIAEHAVLDSKIPVAVFSLEMGEQQLIQRLICCRARVNLQRLRDGFLADRDFPSITSVSNQLAESPLFIIDEKLYIDSLIARARRLKSKHNIKLVVVDYLQLIRARGFKVDNRQAEVSYISNSLKGLAKDLNIPVIVIAQLNRQPESRHGGKPRLSDLRESGAIEQDADFVGLLVRGEVYEEDEIARREKSGEAELIIAKQRNGPIGEIRLTFIKEYTRFEDRAHEVQGEL